MLSLLFRVITAARALIRHRRMSQFMYYKNRARPALFSVANVGDEKLACDSSGKKKARKKRNVKVQRRREFERGGRIGIGAQRACTKVHEHTVTRTKAKTRNESENAVFKCEVSRIRVSSDGCVLSGQQRKTAAGEMGSRNTLASPSALSARRGVTETDILHEAAESASTLYTVGQS